MGLKGVINVSLRAPKAASATIANSWRGSGGLPAASVT
jgi:hypothetical protein